MLLFFPRSADRGHIEATIQTLEAVLSVVFPRSADRGHIEAD